MKPVNQPLLISVMLVVLCLQACSSTLSDEKQAVIDSPTNPDPEISIRAARKNNDVRRGDPEYQPVRLDRYEDFNAPTGSLFKASMSTSLYRYNNHFQIGDMILVELDERTSSQKSNGFNTDKSSDFEIGTLALDVGPIDVNQGDFEMAHGQKGKFASTADANQSNFLSGNITVYVKEILNNGNLLVAGEKWITLNKGKEYIRLTGEIRKQDVSSENTVGSSKVGNASIEYSGQGSLQDNQSKSILDKLFGIFK